MTVEELKNELNKLPVDADVMYLHNQYGRIHIDTVDLKEETSLTGRKYFTVTFSGSHKED